jgi:mono/diheme cytochrome c family protein
MSKHLIIVALATSWFVTAKADAQAPPPGQTQSVLQTSAAAPTGDVKRGKELYDTTYRCYSCHGFDGQTGSPRLVPMMRTQEAFIAYLRKPSTPAMPKFPAVPERDLADVYAYIRSIPAALPPLESIPLLKDVLDQRAKSR